MGQVLTTADLLIEVDGKAVGYLNAALIEANGVPHTNLPLLRLSHGYKHILKEKMRDSTDLHEIIRLGRIWTHVLYFQQSLWGFQLNEDYHNWAEIPHCCCPDTHGKRWGGQAPRPHFIDPDCPVHSWRIKST